MHVEINKIKDILIYLSSKIDKLYFTKVLKLFYYVDFISVLERGKPVSNDCYYKLPYGPVPNLVKDQLGLLRAEIAKNENELFERKDDLFKSIFEGVVTLKKDPATDGFIVKKVDSVPEIYENLSEYEKGLLDDVIKEFGKKSVTDLVNKTHQEQPFMQTSPSNIIDYKLAFHLDRNAILPSRDYKFNVEVSQMQYYEGV